MKNGKSYKFIKTVKPTVDILTFLSNQRQPVGAPEIAAALGIKYGTIMCYLASLEELQFVQRAGDFYELGQGACLLWSRRKAQLKTIISRATEELNELDPASPKGYAEAGPASPKGYAEAGPGYKMPR